MIPLPQVLDTWTWPHHLAVWASPAIWFLYLLVYGVWPLFFSDVLYQLFIGVVAPSPQFWLLLPLIPAITLLPTGFFFMAKRYVAPDDHHIVAEHLAGRRKLRLRATEEDAQEDVVMRIFSKERQQQQLLQQRTALGSFSPAATPMAHGVAAAAAAAATQPLATPAPAGNKQTLLPGSVPYHGSALGDNGPDEAPATAFRAAGPRFLEQALLNNPFRYRGGAAGNGAGSGGPALGFTHSITGMASLGVQMTGVAPNNAGGAGGSVSTRLSAGAAGAAGGAAAGGAAAGGGADNAAAAAGHNPLSLDLYVSVLR